MTEAILVYAGHSGGHLFPALAFAEKMRARHPAALISLITSRKAKPIVASMPPEIFDAVHYLVEFPAPSGFSMRSLKFCFQFPLAFLASASLLYKYKPALCVGFGSYVSYPGIKLASWLKIPVLIHEQNQVPGKATRMLASCADCVAVSFDGTFKSDKLKSRVVTGLPLRSFFFDAASEEKEKSANGIFRVFITGGSQGSHNLNAIILDAFSRLRPEEKKKIAVTHITGSKDFEWVTETYKKAEVLHETFPFAGNMHELYGKADLAITRAGANTLFELALFRLPALVVPYPFAEGHQAANAEYFAERQAVLSRKENSLTGEWLIEQIRQIRDNKALRENLSQRIGELAAPDAATHLADLADRLMNKEDLCPSQNKTSSEIPATHT